MVRFVRVGFVAGIAAVALSGCVSGTTYGTGVSQEEQTLTDVYNMFSLARERKNIDYSPRPDLVVPANKEALPEPVDTAATATTAEWPETPEERIARIRAQAGEVDPRTGEVSVQERLRRKEGIRIEQGYVNDKFVPGITDRDGNQILYNGQASQAQREEVLKRKAELSISQGATRKYLTEPPVEYRIPASTAPSGMEAYTPEELKAIEEAERKEKLEQIKQTNSR